MWGERMTERQCLIGGSKVQGPKSDTCSCTVTWYRFYKWRSTIAALCRYTTVLLMDDVSLLIIILLRCYGSMEQHCTVHAIKDSFDEPQVLKPFKFWLTSAAIHFRAGLPGDPVVHVALLQLCPLTNTPPLGFTGFDGINEPFWHKSYRLLRQISASWAPYYICIVVKTKSYFIYIAVKTRSLCYMYCLL